MNDTNIYERNFSLLFYQIAHEEAVIRSPKNEKNAACKENIDVFMAAIKYFEMPCVFNTLTIDKATIDDKKYLSEKLGQDIEIEDIVVLIEGGKRYYVVASILVTERNDLDYNVLPNYVFLKEYLEIDMAECKREINYLNKCKRNFKLWFYQMFHNEMIIRSPKDDLDVDSDTTIDIWLQGVQYLEMPWKVYELEIVEATITDKQYIRQKLDRNISDHEIVVFVSRQKRYYVVANSVQILESKLDYGQMLVPAYVKNK